MFLAGLHKRIDKETGMLGKVEYWNFVDWAVEWAWNNERGIGGVPAGGYEGWQFFHPVDAIRLCCTTGMPNYSNSLGRRNRLKNMHTIASQITKAVYEKCWDESHGYLADTPAKKEFSMHAQIFAVLTNTIPENNQKALYSDL